ncbi:PP2C family protein-serine/threonine phosphatase [Nocardioides pocheonensis]|uniref:PP2C family protein-serine/threonine phosphatase n=1 Tax=Nocardioides pocheonensis TaxID=661485 RepID=UPI00161D5E04|nr:protein phosphatase 2C domain-containing protein [Nocardioides pocheonensis]
MTSQTSPGSGPDSGADATTGAATGAALHLEFAALSDVGRVRRDNQDSGYAGPNLLVIADGVGGAARGDIASSAAVDAIKKLDVPPGDDALSALSATIHLAHDRLAEIVEAHPELEGTSTTVTAAVFDGTELQVGHVGDSRGYLLHGGILRSLTTDHTLVQSLVDEGRITEQEARVHPHRNLILKAVDGVHEPDPDLFSVPVETGDRVLLCSDGCSGVLEPETMAQLLTGAPLDEAAGALVRAALEAGSSDNVTVVLAEVCDGEAVPAPPAVVGAAATLPHRQLTNDATGNLNETDLTGLEDEELGGLDPEELRYAPRPPRRFGWARRLAVLAVLVLLLGLGAGALYSWSQGQYYVSDDGGTVVIFKGVKAELPGVRTHRVAERTGLTLAELESYDAGRVRSGISAEGLGDARRIIADLKVSCPTPTPTPTPTPAPTPAATAPAGKKSAGATTPPPSPTTAPTTPPSTPATTPSSSPSNLLADPCATATPAPTAGATTPATTPAPTTPGATP